MGGDPQARGLRPNYVSITYGAGGSTQDATLATVDADRPRDQALPGAASHLRRQTKHEVDEVVRSIGRTGIRRIVALRGDPPGGATRYEPTPGGYVNAAELVGGIRALGDFEFSVAAYPEKHPKSFTLEVDLAMLAAKVDNGATSALTQFFFDNSAYFRFVDRARARGIDIPIIPGILPVTNFEPRQAGRRTLRRPPDRRLRPSLRGVGECARGTPPGGRGGRRRAGDGAARRGRQQLPFLHAQPRRCGVRHLPDARAGRQHAHGGGLNGGRNQIRPLCVSSSGASWHRSRI